MGCDDEGYPKPDLKDCGRCQLDQQAISQTGLKLCAVYNTNTKFYACDMKGESFHKSEISPCGY